MIQTNYMKRITAPSKAILNVLEKFREGVVRIMHWGEIGQVIDRRRKWETLEEILYTCFSIFCTIPVSVQRKQNWQTRCCLYTWFMHNIKVNGGNSIDALLQITTKYFRIRFIFHHSIHWEIFNINYQSQLWQSNFL